MGRVSRPDADTYALPGLSRPFFSETQTHIIPTTIPKPTAIAVRKPQLAIETLEESLAAFAKRLTAPDTADYLRKIIAGGSVAKIDITAYRLADGSIGTSMDLSSKLQHERNYFKSLK